ncbi:MAG: hypothetical protein Kow0068_16650 [Marinilabiliales bacterium]
MSDFGGYILIRKNDKKSFNDAEIDNILKHLSSIYNDDFQDVFGEPFLFELSDIEDENDVLFLLLSDYDYDTGEDDSDFSFEVAKQNDLPQINTIHEKLKNYLGDDYTFESHFEEW